MISMLLFVIIICLSASVRLQDWRRHSSPMATSPQRYVKAPATGSSRSFAIEARVRL